MPIFEFQCRSCGATFERILSSADDTASCKKCGSPRVERLHSVFAVVGTSGARATAEPGPCGACGAPRRGMCGE